MSVQYAAISWTSKKRVYDLVLAAGILAYISMFVSISALLYPHATAETLIIRALGTCAFLLLHIVLCIGPLCRLDARFLPLLFNRRHLGVTTFLLGLGHGALALVQFHSFGDRNPLVSLFTANRRFDSVAQFPFQGIGFAALVILYVMAATSHDFWLHNLSAPTWKRIHMLVYAAYGFLVAHVTLGALQSEHSPAAAVITAMGFSVVLGLHLLAARKEKKLDGSKRHTVDSFVFACRVDEIRENRARIVPVAGERVAVFRYGGQVSAVSNVCQHQNGPLGEGRILDGCITCPWHGYQYRPNDGCAPAPFKEKLPTFSVQIRNGDVWISARPNAPGTHVPPAQIADSPKDSAANDDFFVGYLPMPVPLAHRMRWTVSLLTVVTLMIAAALAIIQMGYARSVFEYGQYRSIEGLLLEKPYPMLLVLRPGQTKDSSAPFSVYPLVSQFKHGADGQVRGLDGKHVRMQGALVYRDEQTMLELKPGPIEIVSNSIQVPFSTLKTLGQIIVTGEIVDSKCYLGVMNPGNGKVHRDCAARCISGGVPAAFVATDPIHRGSVYLLQASNGKKLQDALVARVGESITLRGEALQLGDQLVLLQESKP